MLKLEIHHHHHDQPQLREGVFFLKAIHSLLREQLSHQKKQGELIMASLDRLNQSVNNLAGIAEQAVNALQSGAGAPASDGISQGELDGLADRLDNIQTQIASAVARSGYVAPAPPAPEPEPVVEEPAPEIAPE